MPDDLDGGALTRAERLAALNETGLLDALPQESLDRFTRLASLCIGAPVALVSLVDPRRQFFSSMVGLPEPWASQRETPLSHSFCKLVVTTGEALIVSDARADERVRDNLAVRDLGVIAYAGMPIRTGDDHVLGSFCVIDTKPREWSERELQILEGFSEAVIAEVELRRRAMRFEASEKTLGSVNEKLAETVEAVHRASHQMIHDLRTPLGVITLGVSHLLSHDALTSFPEMAKMLSACAATPATPLRCWRASRMRAPPSRPPSPIWARSRSRSRQI